jgi:hypothetical protein
LDENKKDEKKNLAVTRDNMQVQRVNEKKEREEEENKEALAYVDLSVKEDDSPSKVVGEECESKCLPLTLVEGIDKIIVDEYFGSNIENEQPAEEDKDWLDVRMETEQKEVKKSELESFRRNEGMNTLEEEKDDPGYSKNQKAATLNIGDTSNDSMKQLKEVKPIKSHRKIFLNPTHRESKAGGSVNFVGRFGLIDD